LIIPRRGKQSFVKAVCLVVSERNIMRNND
jgi:hypothetical protein